MFELPSKTIGLILPTVSNFFGHNLIEAFEQELASYDFKLIVALTNHNVDKEKEYLSYFSHVTDGIMIISDAQYYDMIADAVPTTVPIIFLNRKPMECPMTAVIENDYAAVYQAVFSLINDGYENVSCICRNPDFSTTKEILHAYKSAMVNSPAGFHDEWIQFYDDSISTVPNIIIKMKSNGCNAFFTASQSLTERFLDYLFLYNSREKERLALAGFTNMGHNSSLLSSIDMVTQPLEQFVDLSVQQIIYLLHHPNTNPKDYIVKGTFRKRIYEPFSTKYKL